SSRQGWCSIHCVTTYCRLRSNGILRASSKNRHSWKKKKGVKEKRLVPKEKLRHLKKTVSPNKLRVLPNLMPETVRKLKTLKSSRQKKKDRRLHPSSRNRLQNHLQKAGLKPERIKEGNFYFCFGLAAHIQPDRFCVFQQANQVR